MSDKSKYIETTLRSVAEVYQQFGESESLGSLIGFFNNHLFQTPIINFSARVNDALEQLTEDNEVYDLFLEMAIRIGMAVDFTQLATALTQEVRSINKNEYFKDVFVDLKDPIVTTLFFIRLYNNSLISQGILIGQQRGISK